MACGNTHVTRAELSSQPSSPQQQGERLFNETRRAEGRVQVQDARGRWMTPDRKYSDLREDGQIHRFLDENRNATLDAALHIHVVHDERNGVVSMQITDRRGALPATHVGGISLKAPSGNEVNEAEAHLATILQTMRSGPR